MEIALVRGRHVGQDPIEAAASARMTTSKQDDRLNRLTPQRESSQAERPPEPLDARLGNRISNKADGDTAGAGLYAGAIAGQFHYIAVSGGIHRLLDGVGVGAGIDGGAV